MTPAFLQKTTIFYRVDGTKFAFNLDWMAAAANKSSMDAARRAAKSGKATHMAWRLGKAQVGLAHVPADAEPPSLTNPWRSAAAAFADLPYSSLLAAFKFTDGRIWVLAANNGKIFSTGDRIFEDETEARAAFDELFAAQYWNDIFAPEGWQSRAKQINPLAVLRRKRPSSRVALLFDAMLATVGLVTRPGAALKPVKIDVKTIATPKTWATAAGLLALVICGGGALKWRAYKAAHRVLAPTADFYPLLIPAKQVLDSCIRALPPTLARYQTPGWAVTSEECVPGQISLTLAPAPDTPVTTMTAFHPEIDTANPKVASTTVGLPDQLEQSVVMRPLMSFEEMRHSFQVLDERTDANNKIDPPVAPAGNPPLAPDGRQRGRPYKISSWTFDTKAPPEMWAPDLAAIPNLEVTNISYAVDEYGLTWSLKGNAYVQQ